MAFTATTIVTITIITRDNYRQPLYYILNTMIVMAIIAITKYLDYDQSYFLLWHQNYNSDNNIIIMTIITKILQHHYSYGSNIIIMAIILILRHSYNVYNCDKNNNNDNNNFKHKKHNNNDNNNDNNNNSRNNSNNNNNKHDNNNDNQ